MRQKERNRSYKFAVMQRINAQMSNILDRMGADINIIVLLMFLIIMILVVMIVSMSIQLNRLKRKYKIFMKGKDAQNLERIFNTRFKDMDRLAKINEGYQLDIELLKMQYSRSLSKYGIVKYDAFEDVGGKLSFALALLDTKNTGFIVDAIHSRDNCFVYIKEIVNGESYIMLSDEEIKALRSAVNYDGEEEI